MEGIALERIVISGNVGPQMHPFERRQILAEEGVGCDQGYDADEEAFATHPITVPARDSPAQGMATSGGSTKSVDKLKTWWAVLDLNQ